MDKDKEEQTFEEWSEANKEGLEKGFEELMEWWKIQRLKKANDEHCRKKGIPTFDEWLDREDEG